MNVYVEHRSLIHFTILAKGVGTSIEVVPDFEGSVDFGPILTKQKIVKTFTFSNKGLRHHKLLICTSQQIKSLKDYIEKP